MDSLNNLSKNLLNSNIGIDDDVLLKEANLLENSFEFEESQERMNLDYIISKIATNVD